MALPKVDIRDATATDLESILALMPEYDTFDGLTFDEVHSRGRYLMTKRISS